MSAARPTPRPRRIPTRTATPARTNARPGSLSAGIKTLSISEPVKYVGTRLARGAGHHQHEAQQNHPFARLGKAHQPVERADRPALPLTAPQSGQVFWSAARIAPQLGQTVVGSSASSSPPANSPLRSRSNRSASRCACGDRPIVYRHWLSRLSVPSSSKAPTPACSFARKRSIAASGHDADRQRRRASRLRDFCGPHVDQPPVGQDQQSSRIVQASVQVDSSQTSGVSPAANWASAACRADRPEAVPRCRCWRSSHASRGIGRLSACWQCLPLSLREMAQSSPFGRGAWGEGVTAHDTKHSTLAHEANHSPLPEG